MPIDLVGALGNRYRVVELIARGGMGQVYLGEDLVQSRRVAIKVLDRDRGRALAPQRFAREIAIIAKLNHPHIVPLYDSGEAAGSLFYVMPYIEGESLREHLNRQSMLPLTQVVQWGVEVAQGLGFAHSHGVIHRDIKPENLLLHEGHLLIADFGVAKALEGDAASSLTSEQVALGTPIYMSPEQATGSACDARSDLYSLACVLYEMLVGEPPFTGATPQAITAKKLGGHYSPIRVVRARVPAAVEEVIAAALAPIAADRPPDAEQFAADLSRAGRSEGARWRLPWAAVGAICLAGIVAVLYQDPSSEPPRTRPKVMVSIFENRTGDQRFDALGFMSADWVVEGLQQTGAVEVIPTLTSLAVTRSYRVSGQTVTPIGQLARSAGATLIVTGSIYLDGDSLVLQAQVADLITGGLLGAVEPIRTVERRAVDAVDQLRARVMGLLALSFDERVGRGDRPPTYAAYKAFSEGMDLYVLNDYGSALPAFQRAYRADTTFVQALLYSAFCYVNQRRYSLADSALRLVTGRRDQLGLHDRDWLDYQLAELSGDHPAALAAIRRAASFAPISKATYNFAARSFEARQPFPAESALQGLSPDVGPMRGWLPYWDLLASALHAQGKHGAELNVGRETIRRFPDRIEALIPAVRAMAALGKGLDLERLWTEAKAKTNAKPGSIGDLAYLAGEELWAHGDSSSALSWFQRAYETYEPGRSGDAAVGTMWGRARSAEYIGKAREAVALVEVLSRQDSARRDEYLGFLGVVHARQGDRGPAGVLMEQLASERRRFAFGEPQFQAGRIAVALGDLRRASQLFDSAGRAGNPYTLDLHRDPILRAPPGRALLDVSAGRAY